jgi:nicotinamide mononucleotide transporter
MHWMIIANYLAANWMEVVGAVTSLVGVWLITRRNLLCWPTVLIAELLYMIVFYRVRLYSGALLQIIFMGVTFYGWWYWWRGIRDEGEVRVVHLPLFNLWAGLAAGTAGSVLMGFLMERMGASLPRLDATLMSYSLVATWWQTRKHTANWWLWIAVDLVYISEYLYKGLRATALLYALLAAVAALGLRDWRRAAAAQTAA